MSYSQTYSFDATEFYKNASNVKHYFFQPLRSRDGSSKNENEHVDDRLPTSNDFQGAIDEGDEYNVFDDSCMRFNDNINIMGNIEKNGEGLPSSSDFEGTNEGNEDLNPRKLITLANVMNFYFQVLILMQLKNTSSS